MRPHKPSHILQASKTKAFLVSNLTNIFYISGVVMSAGLLLLKPRSMTLFADPRYIEAATRDAREGVVVKPLDTLKDAMKSATECGFESDEVTVEKLRTWKRTFKNTKFVRKCGIIEEFRRSKDVEEIGKFRQAQQMTRVLMKRVSGALNIGIAEDQLTWELQQWAHDLGADSLSFDPIVAFGENSSLPHHHPGRRKLRKGDVVQIDVGCRFEGYCADQSQVFFLSKPTKEQQRVYDAVAEAKKAAQDAVKVGVTNHELDTIARDVLKEYDLEEYFTHSLGHGVGLDIHEGISLNAKGKKVKLLEGEIVTIEPGIYLPGKFGMRLEEEIVVGI